jgi:hypothetical protein
MRGSHEVASLRYSSLLTASIVCLLLILAIRVSAQCPPRPRIPDPPGWAIDRRGGGNIYGYQLSEDGAWFGFNSDGGIGLMNVRTGERRQLLPCVEVSAEAFTFAPNSSLMAFGTGNGIIYLFEIPSGALKAELRDDDWVQQLKFGPSGLLIAKRTDDMAAGTRSRCDELIRSRGEHAPKVFGRAFGSISTRRNWALTGSF